MIARPVGSSPLPVYDKVVNLVDSAAIWGCPGKFVDASVWKDGATYDIATVEAKVNQALSIIVDGATPIHVHCLFSVSVVCSHFLIYVSHDDGHVMVWYL